MIYELPFKVICLLGKTFLGNQLKVQNKKTFHCSRQMFRNVKLFRRKTNESALSDRHLFSLVCLSECHNPINTAYNDSLQLIVLCTWFMVQVINTNI